MADSPLKLNDKVGLPWKDPGAAPSMQKAH